MYPKVRLDALTDGIFAVAMTILVLDLHIPDESVGDGGDAALLKALASITPKLIPYLLSFYVLGMSWLALIKARSRGEMVGNAYAKVSMFYLLFVTLLPFSTVLMGRFTSHPLAILTYAVNMAAMASAASILMSLLPEPVRDENWFERRAGLALLLASCAICAILSYASPRNALWAFILNLGGGQATRVYSHLRRQRGTPEAHPK